MYTDGEPCAGGSANDGVERVGKTKTPAFEIEARQPFGVVVLSGDLRLAKKRLCLAAVVELQQVIPEGLGRLEPGSDHGPVPHRPTHDDRLAGFNDLA